MEENDKTKDTTKNEQRIEFKKPVLIGRIGKLPKKAKTEAERSIEQKNVEKSTLETDNSESSNSKSSLPPAVLLKELSTPIPYKEPKWSGLCPDGSDYALEVIKSGMIVERIDLSKKPYFVFGRLANCDVVMAHPTISRHHAVLQYKAFAAEDEPASGWYLYDLGSTHGTLLNKDKLKPAHYTRVRVGHQIKFGTSTRTYIVLGPDFDSEGESDLTVTEIKLKAQEMKVERDRMIKEAIEQREKAKLEEEKKREEQGIDWGMGEDAEDETDLSENPYAQTANEELYLEDPKKTLRGYFEREGHELNYHCEERGPGQFLCRVELPLDDSRGRGVVAEVMQRGKKKDAVVACALEACRLLDRAGLLRQATHESRRRRSKDWRAEDYYDSDDDSYLDRTGTVENKRTKRMIRHGARDKEDEKPLTYDDLLKKISEIEAQIVLEEKNLERLRAAGRGGRQDKTDGGAGDQEDELDAFMNSLKSQGHSMSQKAEISKTKMSIQKLRASLSKTRRLCELARPAHLPPLQTNTSHKMAVKQAPNSVIYGKRIKLKEDVERHKRVRKEVKREEKEFVEEVDTDEEEMQEQNSKEEQSVRNIEESDLNTKESSINTKDSSLNTEKCSLNTEKSDLITKKSSLNTKDSSLNTEGDVAIENKEKVGKPSKVYGPMRPPENYVIPESYFDQETDRDLPNIEETNSL